MVNRMDYNEMKVSALVEIARCESAYSFDVSHDRDSKDMSKALLLNTLDNYFMAGLISREKYEEFLMKNGLSDHVNPANDRIAYGIENASKYPKAYETRHIIRDATEYYKNGLLTRDEYESYMVRIDEIEKALAEVR